MRVGMICPYSLTVPGGVQNQVLGLARALRDQGVDIRVLGPCDGPPPDAGVTPLGNSLPTAANGSIAPIAPDPSAQLRVIRALRDEEFDLLHIHEPMVPGPTMTALFLKQTPVVATFHRSGDSRSYQYLNRWVRWLRRRIEVCVAVSEEAASSVQSQLGGSYEVLFNGVEVDRYRSHETRREERPTVLFIGRHEPRKGLAVLLGAMRDLPPDVVLWVASDGPDTDRLRSEVAGDPRIQWLGVLSEQEKVDRMLRASAFCAPSLSGESFGVVLLEAMAARLPVVASDLAGYRTVATHGRDALLAPAGDPSALAAALDKVLFDENVAASLNSAGAARAESYAMRHLAARYLTLYDKAIGADPAAALA